MILQNYLLCISLIRKIIFLSLENSYTALIISDLIIQVLEFYIASRTIGSTATSATYEVWLRNTTVNNTVELRQAVMLLIN